MNYRILFFSLFPQQQERFQASIGNFLVAAPYPLTQVNLSHTFQHHLIELMWACYRDNKHWPRPRTRWNFIPTWSDKKATRTSTWCPWCRTFILWRIRAMNRLMINREASNRFILCSSCLLRHALWIMMIDLCRRFKINARLLCSCTWYQKVPLMHIIVYIIHFRWICSRFSLASCWIRRRSHRFVDSTTSCSRTLSSWSLRTITVSRRFLALTAFSTSRAMIVPCWVEDRSAPWKRPWPRTKRTAGISRPFGKRLWVLWMTLANRFIKSFQFLPFGKMRLMP